MKDFLVRLLAAIAYEMLRFAAQMQSRPDTASDADGPEGMRSRIIELVRSRMREATGDSRSSDQ